MSVTTLIHSLALRACISAVRVWSARPRSRFGLVFPRLQSAVQRPIVTEANSAAVTVPRDEYRRRRAAFLVEAKQLARRDRRLSRLRAVLFLAGIACVPLAARFDAVAWWWCLVPAVAFLIAVVRHE